MPPPVFWGKSAEVIENKGSGWEKERQERLRVRKRKEIKEIEEVREVRSARFVRDNTRNGAMDAICLSIVNLIQWFECRGRKSQKPHPST